MSEEEKVENVEMKNDSLAPPAREPFVEGCTCNDEFAVVVCPVHHKEVSTVEEETLTITDEYLVSNEMGMWRGYIFMCPDCSKPGIMANPALGKRCACCGRRVLIKSKVVTEVIRKIEKQDV